MGASSITVGPTGSVLRPARFFEFAWFFLLTAEPPLLLLLTTC
jgi:hypothetical protein